MDAGEAAWEEVRETFRDQLQISAETRAAHIGHLDPWPEAITPDWVREKIPRVKDASDARILDALDAVAHMTDRIQEEARGYMDLMDDRLLAQFDRGAFVRTQGSTEDVPLQEWEKGTSFFASSGAGQGWSYRISLTREAHPELVERRELLWELTDSREQAMRTMLR